MSESHDKESSALPIGICGAIASLGMLGIIFFRLPRNLHVRGVGRHDNEHVLLLLTGRQRLLTAG